MNENASIEKEITMCYCDSTPVGIICSVCEKEFFDLEVEEMELEEVW